MHVALNMRGACSQDQIMLKSLLACCLLFFCTGLSAPAENYRYFSGENSQQGSGFWLGSRSEEVYSKQGIPDSVERPDVKTEIWHYGQSSVTITAGSVSAYKNGGKNLFLLPSFASKSDLTIQPTMPLANVQSGQEIQPTNRQPSMPIANIDYGPYMADIQRHVGRIWRAPQGYRVGLAFVIHKSGQISNLRITESSGSRQVDDAALNALEASCPLRVPPAGADNVEMKMTFESANRVH